MRSDRACPTPLERRLPAGVLLGGTARSRWRRGARHVALHPGPRQGRPGRRPRTWRRGWTRSPATARRSSGVFGAGPTVETVPKALAAFLRTLVADRSAWVRFQDGETDALSAQARRGWASSTARPAARSATTACCSPTCSSTTWASGRGRRSRSAAASAITQAGARPRRLQDADAAERRPDRAVLPRRQRGHARGGGGPDGGRRDRQPGPDAALRAVTLTAAERAALLAFLRALTVDIEIAPPELPQ